MYIILQYALTLSNVPIPSLYNIYKILTRGHVLKGCGHHRFVCYVSTFSFTF